MLDERRTRDGDPRGRWRETQISVLGVAMKPSSAVG
jgi:hypothetical protein